ncbi:MAG: MobA/MobL family protein [Dokdonella sp.]
MVSLRETVRSGLRPDTPAVISAPNARPQRGVAETTNKSTTIAIFHANVKAFSRGKGHSATAAAAYRAGLAITDDRTGLVHDYSRRKGVASVDQLAPEGAPDWCRDPAAFWNANEVAETRANARVAREIEVALPAELDGDQRHALAVDLGRLLVERFQVAALVAVHAPAGHGDDRNHHAHILVSARQVSADGLGSRAMAAFDARQGAGADAVRQVREAVADRINQHLERAGLWDWVDHRSLADQAQAAEARSDHAAAIVLARSPTIHEGKTNTAAARTGTTLDRVAENNTIHADNAALLADYLATAQAEGRLLPTPAGEAERAQTDWARENTPQASDADPDPVKHRQAPTGPLVHISVQGYTRVRVGKTGRVAGHARKHHSAATARTVVGATTGRTSCATGAGAAVLNAQTALTAEGANISAASAQAYIDKLAEAPRQTQTTIDAYIRAQRLSVEDADALAAHCQRDKWCTALLRQSLDARSRVRRAKGRPLRRRKVYGEAMNATAQERKAAEALDQTKPSFWRPLSRRDWAEKRRRQSERVANAERSERWARRGVGHEAMEGYAAEEKAARSAWVRVEHERRTRFTIPMDIAREMAITNKAMEAFLSGLDANGQPDQTPDPLIPTAPHDDRAPGKGKRSTMRPR